MKSIAAPLLFILALVLPPLAPLAKGQSAKFTTLYKFSVTDGSAGNYNGVNADGIYPNPVVQGTDGNFYGTTWKGGPYTYGTAFKLTPGGTLIVLQRFGNNNGANPEAPLLLGSDGGFYGTTYGGGNGGGGTIFRLTAAGKLTALHRFTGNADGRWGQATRRPDPGTRRQLLRRDAPRWHAQRGHGLPDDPGRGGDGAAPILRRQFSQ